MNHLFCAALSSSPAATELPPISHHPPSLGSLWPLHSEIPKSCSITRVLQGCTSLGNSSTLRNSQSQEQQLFIFPQGATNSPSMAVLRIRLGGEIPCPWQRKWNKILRPSPIQTQDPTPDPVSSAAQLANNPNKPRLPPFLLLVSTVPTPLTELPCRKPFPGSFPREDQPRFGRK